MRTKRPVGDASAPSTIEGEKTVIHVGPDEIHQRHPRQLKIRGLNFLDVVGYVVMVSAVTLGAFVALAYLLDRMREWLSV
jgi:hypothetical protein